MLTQPIEPKLELVDHPLLREKGVDLLIYRTDLSHPQISGNKWYKLKYNLKEAKAQGFNTVLSFGGAYSNHLHALAYAGNQAGIRTVGIVRGELMEPLNPTLQDARSWGMELIGVSRSNYKKRHNQEYIEQLVAEFGPCYIVPEGGANKLALQGCAEISQSLQQQIPDFDYLCVPCGTGATLAGLIVGLSKPQVNLLGFCALKGLQDIEQNVLNLLDEAEVSSSNNWQIVHDFHCGGFAKLTPELVKFLDQWESTSEIPLEPIYTGKMLYGLIQMINADRFPSGSKIVAVHTGGLQGLRGMESRMQRVRKLNPSV